MHKIACAVFVASVVAVVQSNAAITSFYWTSNANEAKNNTGSNLSSGKTLLTFVSSDTSINWDSTWIDSTDGGRFGARGDDNFLFNFKTTGVAGGKYSTAQLDDPAGTYVNKYVYGVLLDLAYGSPVVNSTYYDLMSGTKGPLLNIDKSPNPNDPPQAFTDGLLQTASQISIVPEPGTIVLVAVGLCVLAGVRKRRSP